MNFIANETPQKLRGGYYTEPDIATFLTRWVLEARPRRLLEPACGDGVFFQAIADLGTISPEAVVGCEIDADEAKKARARGRRLKDALTVEVDDFLHWSLPRLNRPPEFDAVLGNPPFVRYQYLDPKQQRRAGQIFVSLGLPFTKHTNAWVPFVIASLAQLRPGGRLALVVPAEILHVIHAGALRQFLLAQCSRVLILDPEEIWFDGTLQGVVLLLAEKRRDGDTPPGKLAVVPIKDRTALAIPARTYFEQADFVDGAALAGKWTHSLLTQRERSLVRDLAQLRGVRPFAEVATVDVGIVTGANKFFLVSDDVIEAYQLSPWAHPAFGRSDHVSGVVYDRKNHEENRKRGLPTNLLWFDGLTATHGARKYLKEGEEQGLHRRFKCRIRTPWYRVPSVYVAPVGMLKRCHHHPRLVLNSMNAYTTDTAYRVMPKTMAAADLVTAFVNSLTALCSELEGRHYGGGVLELVPSEIERLLVPVVKTGSAALRQLDHAIRTGTAPETVLARQDEVVLKSLSITKNDRDVLRGAWERLRKRRQRANGLPTTG